MSLFDDVKRNLVEWYGVAADKTGVAAKIGSRKYDIFGLSRDIERQFSEIGNLVYKGIESGKENIVEDSELLELVERVRELEKELAQKEAEIAEIRTTEAASKETEEVLEVEEVDVEELPEDK